MKKIFLMLSVPLALLTAACGNVTPRATDAVTTNVAALAPTKNIVIQRLGDSLTIGVGSSWGTGYEPELTRLLRQHGVEPTYAPIGGSTNWDVQGLRKIVDASLAASHPDVVLLDVGTNNAAGSCGTPPCAGMTNYQAAFYDLVQRILVDAPQAHLFIAEIQYASKPWAVQQVYANATHITATWQTWCAGRCTLVHMQGIDRCTGLSDGTHPNDSGYMRMADQWGRAMLTREGVTVWPAKVIESGVPRPGFEVPAVRVANGC